MNKTIIILILNVAVIITALVGLYIAFAYNLGLGMRGVEANSTRGIAGSLILIGIPVLAILSIVFSHIDHSNRAYLWAVLPIGIGIAIYAFLTIQDIQNKKETASLVESELAQNTVRYADRKKFVNSFSKAYVCSAIGDEESFLTIDTEKKLIVHVSLSKDALGAPEISASPVGIISGHTLKTYVYSHDNNKIYEDCKDSNEKTIYENYTVVDTPSLNPDDFISDKYQNFQ